MSTYRRTLRDFGPCGSWPSDNGKVAQGGPPGCYSQGGEHDVCDVRLDSTIYQTARKEKEMGIGEDESTRKSHLSCLPDPLLSPDRTRCGPKKYGFQWRKLEKIYGARACPPRLGVVWRDHLTAHATQEPRHLPEIQELCLHVLSTE